MPIINITKSSRSDSIWNAKISDLAPNTKVILTALMTDTLGQTWQSQAEFIAPESGEIDLAEQAPIRGSYTAADAMGLIWSMTCKDVHGLLSRRFDLSPVTIQVRVQNGAEEAETSVVRYPVEPSVIRKDIREAGIVGTLYLPEEEKASAPKAAVIVLSGSEGGFRNEQAALLASEGYVALALAYFNVPEVAGFPTQIKEIPLEYFENAIKYLQALPQVSASQIGVIGTSRGGELALLLGATFNSIKSVVAYVPNHAVQAAFGPSDHLEDEIEPSWTYQGKALACFPLKVDGVKWFDKAPVVLKNGFLTASKSGDAGAQRLNLDAVIKVEKMNGPVLLISGGHDEMWPSEEMCQLIMERLQRYNHPHLSKCQHLNYPEAGHLIMVPWWPTTGGHAVHPIDNVDYEFGGTPSADAHAGYDSWVAIKDFLRKNLTPGLVNNPKAITERTPLVSKL